MTPTVNPAWPTMTGPHRVGTDEFVVVDSERPSPLQRDGHGRRLMARAWYPTTERGTGRMLFEAGEYDAYAGAMLTFVGAPPDLLAPLAELRTCSIPGAKPLSGALPTVVFSHGGPAYHTQNTALLEEVASHGYLAVSVGHPGLSAGLCLDGEVIAMAQPYAEALRESLADAELGGQHGLSIEQRHDLLLRILDTRKLAQFLPRFRDDGIATVDVLLGEGPAIEGVTADAARIVYAGMSFGGSASVSAAQHDPRARGAINIDGLHWSRDAYDTDVRTPLLEVNSDPSLGPLVDVFINSFFYEPLRRLGMREDVVRVTVRGTAHMDFLDAVLMPSPRPLSPGWTDGRRVHEILSTLVLRFLDAAWSGSGFDNVHADLPEVSRVDLSAHRSWALSRLQGT